MEKYVIITDLDGTLMEDWDKYNSDSLEYLKKIKNDHVVMIATGRPWRASKKIYDLLELDTPIINYNGAYVHNPTDPSYKSRNKTFDKGPILKLLKEKDHWIRGAYFEYEDTIYFHNYSEDLNQYLALRDEAKCIYGDIYNKLTIDPHAVVFIAKDEHKTDFYNYIVNETDLDCRHWGSNYDNIIEICNDDITKGDSLLEIFEDLNLDIEKSIAFGDELNDVTMIKTVKYGVAMENCAPERLGRHAEYITKKNTEGGIKVFLEDFFKGNFNKYKNDNK